MKLEIKHLAHYLPYGLKVSSLHTLNAETGIGNINHIVKAVNEGKKQYKPRLRPLYDLTKEMEIYDKKITFIDWVKQTLGYNVFEYQGYFKDAHWFKLEGEEPAILHLPYSIIETLFYLHFDVFGLIEKGLAIDINDVVLADA